MTTHAQELQLEIAIANELQRRLANGESDVEAMEGLTRENIILRSHCDELRQMCRDLRECYEALHMACAAMGDKHIGRVLVRVAAERFAPKPKEPTP